MNNHLPPGKCKALNLYRQAIEDTDLALFCLYRNQILMLPASEYGALIESRKMKERLYIMEWVFLVIAGGLEVFWSTCMKFSNGFTEIKFTILTVVGMIFSFLFLSQATKTLPLGTAYAVWTGIGALGAVIVGIVLFKEPVTAARIFFVSLLLIGIVGLKATSGH